MKKSKLGNIYYNPYFGDDWVIRMIHDDSDNEVLVATSIYNDVDELIDDIDLKRMVYIGNIFEIVEDELIKREEQSN